MIVNQLLRMTGVLILVAACCSSVVFAQDIVDGLYWDPARDGLGLIFEKQGNLVVATAYATDPDTGHPLFWFGSNSVSEYVNPLPLPDGTLVGVLPDVTINLKSYNNGPCLECGPSQKTLREEYGDTRFRWESPHRIEVTWPSGETARFERFYFGVGAYLGLIADGYVYAVRSPAPGSHSASLYVFNERSTSNGMPSATGSTDDGSRQVVAVEDDGMNIITITDEDAAGNRILYQCHFDQVSKSGAGCRYWDLSPGEEPAGIGSAAGLYRVGSQIEARR